jgi:NADH-quinone oxidoreductase subunit I
MPIDPKEVVWIEEPRLGLLEALYLPAIFNGLKTTLKHAMQPPVTMQYPEEKPTLPPHFKGVHRLNRDDKGRVKCVACFLCSTACPAHCIEIEAAEADISDPHWADRDKYPSKFVIDELRCIYCGMCEEACPVDAIELTTLYNLSELGASDARSQYMFNRDKLLGIYDLTTRMGTDPVRTHMGPLSIASEPGETKAGLSP